MGRYDNVCRESRVLNLWLLLLVATVSIIVFLWIGTLFLQGYIYTEPTPGLFWQAPVAGLVVGGFLAFWCMVVANSADANPEDIPYDTLFRFSPRVEMVKEPVKELWAVKKNDEKVRYTRHRIDQRRYEYKDTTLLQRPWNATGVKAIELEHGGEKYRFDLTISESGAYPRFVNNKGWSMPAFESGPTGIPTTFRTSRFLANLFFNFLHLGLWFACLWLVLQFQWSHALGLGFCLWLLFTLALMPMMLSYAAEVAQSRPPTRTSATCFSGVDLV
jgi:hypothetical protein